MRKIPLSLVAITVVALCAACSDSTAVDQTKSNVSTSAEVVSSESTDTGEASMEAEAEPTLEIPEAMTDTDNNKASPSNEAASTPVAQAPASSENSIHSTLSEANASSSTDSRKQAFDQYVNGRYGYSIDYPTTWTAGEESDNGDGKILYVGNPDIDIRVYAANYMEDVSDPYHNEDKHVKRQRVMLDNGKEGTLVTGKEGDKIMYDMAYVSQNDVEYHFYAEVSPKFFEQNEKLLLSVAKSLDFPEE